MCELIISSPAFAQEDWIPDCYSGFGVDKSPELLIENIDVNTVSIAVTLDDLGHPIRPGYNHWLAWNLPPVHVIPENLPKGADINLPFHFVQGLAYGKHCYRGPKPPFNWNHRYCFTVYTLNTMLSINTDSDKTALMKAMNGHIIQTGCLFGKYQRKHSV